MSDRRVHARLANGDMVVRYERAGKWYLEHDVAPPKGRKLLTIADAVLLASAPDAARYWKRPGGAAFDAKLERLLSSASTSPSSGCSTTGGTE